MFHPGTKTDSKIKPMAVSCRCPFVLYTGVADTRRGYNGVVLKTGFAALRVLQSAHSWQIMLCEYSSVLILGRLCSASVLILGKSCSELVFILGRLYEDMSSFWNRFFAFCKRHSSTVLWSCVFHIAVPCFSVIWMVIDR